MEAYISYKGLIDRGWSKKLICQYLADVPQIEPGNRIPLRDRVWSLSVVESAEQSEEIKKAVSDMRELRNKATPYTPEQKMIIDHNTSIIEDNIAYGEKQILRGDASEEVVEQYRKEAYEELKSLKQFMRNGGTPIYCEEHELYEIP